MKPRFVVFDVMGTLFDLQPVRARLVGAGAPGGALEAWFGRLLHSAASLTLSGQFRPFGEIAETTLRSTLAQLSVDEDRAVEVLAALGELVPFPDAEPAFLRLEQAGVECATLTNGGEKHTRALLERAGLLHRVAAVISVEEVRAYKPAAERPIGTPRSGRWPSRMSSYSSPRTGGTYPALGLPGYARSGSTGSSGTGRSRSTSRRGPPASARPSSSRSATASHVPASKWQ